MLKFVPGPVLTWAQLAKVLGVESPETHAEKVWEMIADGDFSYAEDQAEAELGEDATDEQREEARTKARDACIDEECVEADRKYRDAVRVVAEKLFAEHHLDLVEDEKTGTFAVEPRKPRGLRDARGRFTSGWYRAAKELIETINGVGMFGFDNVEDFVSSGPYASLQDAVMCHVGWIGDWPDVYEGTKARSMVERRLR